MQKLRSLHLYLGCIFAPMLLLFAISGIWQMYGYGDSTTLRTLSTIHTAHGWKIDGTSNLNSRFMNGFVLVMAVSFIITTVLGIIMALKFGHSRRAAIYCLAFGTAFPLLLAVLAAFRVFG